MPKVCPMDGVSKREDMKNLVLEWEKKIPTINNAAKPIAKYLIIR